MADHADLLRRIRAALEMRSPHPRYLLALLGEAAAFLQGEALPYDDALFDDLMGPV